MTEEVEELYSEFEVNSLGKFGPPNGTLRSSNLGVVNNQVNLPRLVQFGLKLNF